MKISHFIIVAFFTLMSSCSAQKALECVKAQKGNTGNRGIISAEDMDKPREGKDYFALELKAKKKCTLEIVNLTVKEDGGQVLLKPTFENNTSKMALKAGETCYVRVEKENNAIVAKPTLKNAGSLTVKVNGKTMVMPIEKFEEIMPQ